VARRNHHTPEQIIHLLRQAEVELAAGQPVAQVCRRLGITERMYYRWRKEYGGVPTDHAKRVEDLERENARLKQLLAEAELD
jgi:transposase-like protein